MQRSAPNVLYFETGPDNPPTLRIPAVERRQLCTENGSLNSFHARVVTDLLVVMTATLSVIAKLAKSLGDRPIRRHDGTRVA